MDLSNARGKELNAQIAYRLEEYEKARAAYASLVKESADDFSGERLANYAAAAALSWCVCLFVYTRRQPLLCRLAKLHLKQQEPERSNRIESSKIRAVVGNQQCLSAELRARVPRA